ARGSSGRYGLCNRLSVLYFPFSETTPFCAANKYLFIKLARKDAAYSPICTDDFAAREVKTS
ncbi:hypothetical protein, partial [Escherichia coli]|uniref:hypothetical protein n=1 Tax=Escherichia coli TaxID=562 RepID=UPI001BC834A4